MHIHLPGGYALPLLGSFYADAGYQDVEKMLEAFYIMHALVCLLFRYFNALDDVYVETEHESVRLSAPLHTYILQVYQ